MNRKMVLLNVTLIALTLLLGWELRQRWVEAHAVEAAALNTSPKPNPVQSPSTPPAVNPAVPADYIDVAQRTLFSKDRDPNVIIEPPPPPPPPPAPKPLPPLPVYHGQMTLGDPSILLSLDQKTQRAYRAGDHVGEFLLLAFDRDTITIEWDNRVFERNLSELKEDPAVAKRPAAPAAQPQASAQEAPSRSKVGKIGSTKSDDVKQGRQVGQVRMCDPGDTSPNGTEHDGFKKKETVTLMGPTCIWEPVN